jgi:NTE family protein
VIVATNPALSHLSTAGGQTTLCQQPSIALALGGGSARGLAHVVMLEAFDELGIKPVAIAGTSFGAMVGGLYASGLSALEIRAVVEDLLATRTEIFRRVAKSYDGLRNLWNFRAPSVVDGVTLFEVLLPALRCDFASLKIPFSAVAVDYYSMQQVILDQGPVIPAVAASCALPSILRPVVIGGRVLVDGGFRNPCPWDVVAAKAEYTVAVDVTAITSRGDEQAVPNPIEAWIGSTQILFHSITDAKIASAPPTLMIRPAVGIFGTMDFSRYREIFTASEPAKDELKRGLDTLLSGGTVSDRLVRLAALAQD